MRCRLSACPACTVFCGGRDVYLWQLCRGQTTRSSLEPVYPFCYYKRCNYLRIGADDGTVSDSVGYDFNDNECRRIRLGIADYIAGGNRDGG